MNEWFPCSYALSLMVLVGGCAGILGYFVGRWREQLALLETFGPRHPIDLIHNM